MSGHSKWSTIKRKKGAADSKRAQTFSKIIKEITIAAKLGGGDVDANPRLRMAVDKARSNSLPKDTLERAIKKGSGELEGETYEEISYEGYGPSGVAVLVECTTDNKNRTVAEIRHIFARKGGNLAETGAVGWMFEKKGTMRVDAASISEEALFEKALDAGAEDIAREGDEFIITVGFNDFHGINTQLKNEGITIKEAAVEMIPKNLVKIEDEEAAQKILNMVESLEDNDDVQNVWANFDIDDSLLEKLS